MTLTFASIILSAGWIFWLFTLAAHCRAVPAGWTRISLLSSASVIVVLAFASIGGMLLLTALTGPVEAVRSLTVPMIVATVVAPALAVLLTPRLRRPLARAEAQRGGAARAQG